MVMPGDTVQMTVALIQPIAWKGLGFAICEGGRTVGAGTVIKWDADYCPAVQEFQTDMLQVEHCS